MNYEDLAKRIEMAKTQKAKDESWWKGNDELWWNGYIAALHDIRNDLNTGGKRKLE